MNANGYLTFCCMKALLLARYLNSVCRREVVCLPAVRRWIPLTQLTRHIDPQIVPEVPAKTVAEEIPEYAQPTHTFKET